MKVKHSLFSAAMFGTDCQLFIKKLKKSVNCTVNMHNIFEKLAKMRNFATVN